MNRKLFLPFIIALIFFTAGCGIVDSSEEAAPAVAARYELFPVGEATTGVHILVTEDDNEFAKFYRPKSGERVVIELPWKLCSKGVVHVTHYYRSLAGASSTTYAFTVEDFEVNEKTEGPIETFRVRNVKG